MWSQTRTDTVVGCWLSEIGVSTMSGSGSSICSCAFEPPLSERVKEAEIERH